MAMKKIMSSKMTKTTASKTDKPKYLKLEKGERQAVRKAGVRKAAKKGNIDEIYDSASGGRLVTSKMLKNASTTPGRINEGGLSLYTRPGAGEIKSRSTVKTEKNPDLSRFEQQNIQAKKDNQAAFEKTRLGSRLVKKAEKNAAKLGKEVKRSTGTVKNRTKYYGK